MDTTQKIEQLSLQSERHYYAGDYAAAAKLLEQAVELQASPALLSNLGYMLQLNLRHRESLTILERALAMEPDYVPALTNLGRALINCNEKDRAEGYLNRALEISPDDGTAWSNLSLVYLSQGAWSKARSAILEALRYQADTADNWNNLGSILQESTDPKAAIKAYDIAQSIEPDNPAALSNAKMCRQYLPAAGSAGLRNKHIPHATKIEVRPSLHQDPVMRIGYVSADFRKHPVGFFLDTVLSGHNTNDNAGIEIFCYNNHPTPDTITERLQQHGALWRDISTQTAEAAATLITEDGIDLLIDLSGHTAGSRLDIFALSPAPLQLSWLGFFASTELSYIDGVMLSEDQLVDGGERFFSEPVLPLQGSQFNYSPPDYLPALAPCPVEEKGFIRFGCFNNIAKLNADVLYCWANILAAIPDSRLTLKWKGMSDPELQASLRAPFIALNVADRLDLADHTPHQNMLADYHAIDIALDPWPFSGALSSCEAIAMGLPIITLAQLRPVSRQTASILKQLGKAHWVTATPAQYQSLAIELARDKETLKQWRSSSREVLLEQGKQQGKNIAVQIENYARQYIDSGH